MKWSHGTKSHMLGRKLYSEKRKQSQLKVDFYELLCFGSHKVQLASRHVLSIPYRMTGSYKGCIADGTVSSFSIRIYWLESLYLSLLFSLFRKLSARSGKIVRPFTFWLKFLRQMVNNRSLSEAALSMFFMNRILLTERVRSP